MFASLTNPNLRGAVFMMTALAAYTFNDAFIKLAMLEVGLFQAIAVRGVMASAFLFGLCLHQGAFRAPIVGRDRGFVALRVGAEVIGTATFLTALLNAPLANVTAILQIVPLAVTLAAALFLGEVIGWRRMLAIGLAFGGVLLIIRPTAEGFTDTSYLALITVVCIVVRDLTTRKLSPGISALKVALFTALAITALGWAGLLRETWEPLEASEWFFLLAAAVSIIGGYVFSVLAMQTGDVAFVAPFRYTVMVWALLLGLILFQEVPDRLTFVGILIVIAAGLFAWWRERQSSPPRA
ncbi:MAG: DMT family transporter [Pseudomonadota bacterium]